MKHNHYLFTRTDTLRRDRAGRFRRREGLLTVGAREAISYSGSGSVTNYYSSYSYISELEASYKSPAPLTRPSPSPR